MFESRRVAARKERLFTGAKVRGPIPVRHELVHDALVQAALDPSVRAIEHLPSASFAGQTIALDAVVLTRAEGRFALDIVEARQVRDIDDEGFVLLALQDLGVRLHTLSAANVNTEPRFTNSRLVWACRTARVGVGLRLQILQTLQDEGPMPLGRLLSSLKSAADPAPALLALACADLVEVDLEEVPLGPSTRVRSRR
jgi:hypothetical protein